MEMLSAFSPCDYWDLCPHNKFVVAAKSRQESINHWSLSLRISYPFWFFFSELTTFLVGLRDELDENIAFCPLWSFFYIRCGKVSSSVQGCNFTWNVNQHWVIHILAQVYNNARFSSYKIWHLVPPSMSIELNINSYITSKTPRSML